MLPLISSVIVDLFYNKLLIKMEAQIDQLYDTLLRVEQETDNKALLDWVESVCQKEFGLVDGLVANFIQNID